MRDAEFKAWLVEQGMQQSSVQTRLSDARRVESHYGDLDAAYDEDQLEGLLAAFAYSADDKRVGRPNPTKLVIDGDIYFSLASYRGGITTYRKFRDGATAAPDLPPMVAAAEEMLRARYGAPIVETKKIIGFELPDGKQLALKRDIQSIHLWLEWTSGQASPVGSLIAEYEPDQGRNSNLPPRLKHEPPTGVKPRSVAVGEVADIASLGRVLEWYEGQPSLVDRTALERLREKFLALHPDFRTFAECPSFAREEDDYKRALVARAAELIHQHEDSSELGAALLDLACGNSGLFSNLIDWRAAGLVDGVRTAHPGVVEAAVGRMVQAGGDASAVISCIDAIWPLFSEGRPSKPYAESRMVPTMVQALAHPDRMFGIRSTPTNSAHILLLGKPAFAWDRLTAPELDSVLGMARELRRIMQEEWRWAPRDLWDVQSFVWETCQDLKTVKQALSDPSPESDRSTKPMPAPTNLILYGPPGTGKTYATALEAVRLCDMLDESTAGERYPATDEGREALMARYRELQDPRDLRIDFVTFHQSYAYEDFVEGLRPGTLTTDEDGPEQSSPGLQLKVHDGVFKAHCERARRSQAEGGKEQRLDRSRVVFKISLGRRVEEEAQIAEGLRDGIIHLGWGGDIDWADEAFDGFQEIFDEWRRLKDAQASGKDANIEMIFTFRAAMQPGDYVILSDGRDRFRAVGRIASPYFYDQSAAYHPHRRRVEWIWSDPKGQSRDVFYPNYFRQHSTYRLDQSVIDWDALDLLVFGNDQRDEGGLPHVLIIDEINRANISKVFGELITLVEPDKRHGSTNALTVTLPYSKKKFGVPGNIHIIGTMNTADRSIALLDTALRRRFDFREIAPEPGLLGTDVAGVNLRQVLTRINQRIEYLVDREHRIGHAFFIGCKDRNAIDAAMRNKVIPLLQEYFFEDWSRVHAVLGDGFIGQTVLQPPPGIAGGPMASWFVYQPFAKDAYARLCGAPADPLLVTAFDEPPAGDAGA